MTTEKLFSGSIPLPRVRYADPLGLVRADLRQELGEGEAVSCPCCGQRAKIYSRPMNGTMIKSLLEVAKSPYGLTNAAIIARTHQAGGGNLSLLQHWGFVESWPGHVWRATFQGRRFLSGVVSVPSRVLLYNNIFLGFDEREMVTVKDVYGRKFDLDDISLYAENGEAKEAAE